MQMCELAWGQAERPETHEAVKMGGLKAEEEW
jgi:hypothetical protein